MQFHNTTLEEITDKTIVVYINTGHSLDSCDKCRTFIADGKLHIDFIPQFPRLHSAIVPDDAMLMKSQHGDFAIMILPDTVAGKFLRNLWKEQLRQIAQSN